MGSNMQKINILGMSLTDYSLREALSITDCFLEEGSLNTILFISAKILVGAGNSAEQQEWIAGADLIVWSDAEIVRRAGINAGERIHEVENQDYIKEVLKRLGRAGSPVYLLAESEEELERLEFDLRSSRDDLNIVGEDVVGDVEAEWDSAANHINESAPTAVISRIPFERQARLMDRTKRFLNADIWLALDYEMLPDSRRASFPRRLLGKWYHLLFQRLLTEYHHADRENKAPGTESK